MAALMGAGTFGVHQMRFALPIGHGPGGSQTFGGHRYLVAVAPLLAGVLLLALAAGLARLARGVPEPAPRFRRLWAGASGSLFAVYCAQESIEGMLTAGHPGGVAGVLGHGGWVALPLAIAIGLAIALAMRGAALATALVAARAPWAVPPPVAALRFLLPPPAPRRTEACARHLAARGPPAISV
jgi:hypothetical protein